MRDFLNWLLLTRVLSSEPPLIPQCVYSPERDDFPGGSFPTGFRWSLGLEVLVAMLFLST